MSVNMWFTNWFETKLTRGQYQWVNERFKSNDKIGRVFVEKATEHH